MGFSVITPSNELLASRAMPRRTVAEHIIMIECRMPFSDYVVYVDESGDHSLQSIDPNFPVFSLVFCIFKKSDFVETVVPVVQRLKFDFWGYDAVVLRGYEIRKQHGDFNILRGPTSARLSSSK